MPSLPVPDWLTDPELIRAWHALDDFPESTEGWQGYYKNLRQRMADWMAQQDMFTIRELMDYFGVSRSYAESVAKKIAVCLGKIGPSDTNMWRARQPQ